MRAHCQAPRTPLPRRGVATHTRGTWRRSGPGRQCPTAAAPPTRPKCRTCGSESPRQSSACAPAICDTQRRRGYKRKRGVARSCLGERSREPSRAPDDSAAQPHLAEAVRDRALNDARLARRRVADDDDLRRARREYKGKGDGGSRSSSRNSAGNRLFCAPSARHPVPTSYQVIK